MVASHPRQHNPSERRLWAQDGEGHHSAPTLTNTPVHTVGPAWVMGLPGGNGGSSPTVGARTDNPAGDRCVGQAIPTVLQRGRWGLKAK